jgi:hypothetical protein
MPSGSEVKETLGLVIGGVDIALYSALPINIGASGSAYGAFLQKGINAADVDVELEISFDGMPETDAMDLVIDNGESWQIYRDGADYLFSHKSPEHDKAFQMVRLGSDLKTGVIYCGSLQAEAIRAGRALNTPLLYPLDQLIMIYILARKNGAVVHAAGMEIGGKVYIFPGKSGAGKSTMSRQFRGRKDVVALNDDRMVLRRINNGYMAYGTPWPGEEDIALNRGAPPAGIVFIAHAEENRIERIAPVRAAEKLMSVVSIPWHDREIADLLLSFCDGLVSEIDAYEFHCRPGPELADYFFDALGLETAKS